MTQRAQVQPQEDVEEDLGGVSSIAHAVPPDHLITPDLTAMRSIRMTASNVRAEWGDLVEGVTAKQYRVIVERYGRPVAAVISADDFEAITQERDEELARLRESNEMLQKKLATLTSRFAETIREIVPEELDRMERSIERIRRELELVQADSA